MEYRILGPLQVVDGRGQHLALEPRHARVLAALLLAGSHTVSRQRLIEAVWDDDPPATVGRQLRNLVSTLRHRLATAGAALPVIVHDEGGYQIRVEDGQLDALRFTAQVAQGQALLANERAVDAAERLRAALALWRGPALAGCTGAAIEAGAARLDEQRLATLEQCLDLELQLGRHRELIAELTELVATHPLREHTVGQLMLALHRGGRQAEALDAYQRLRVRLSDELGIDPGQTVQQLHAAILRNEPGVTAPTSSAAAMVVPRHLPPPVRHFVGRTAELHDLSRLADEAAGGGPTVIAAIGGTGGIGKTALAVHWAHKAADRFPDGQLYVNLRGFESTGSRRTPAEVIRGFLDAFQVPVDRIPVDPDAQVGLYRSLIAGRRMLLVLDNASDADQIRPLLPGSSGCLVLLTSRYQLAGLVASEGAQPITLDVLTDAEARDLLARHLGARRVAVESAATDELITRCARLPLALAIVAARAAANRTFPLSALAAELGDTRGRLDVLDTFDPHTQPRAVFSWSYQRLTPPAARLFRLLGLHPGPDIAVPAAASLAGAPAAKAQRALVELTRAHLLTEHLPGRYTFHDLLRAYAAELARSVDRDGDLRAALVRTLDHYLHSAFAADRLIYPPRKPITLVPHDPLVVPEDHDDDAGAMAWFASEHRVLLATIRLAVDGGFDEYVAPMAWTLTTFLDRRGQWYDWAAIQNAALGAARRTCDLDAELRAHGSLASAYLSLGQLDDARTHWQHVLDLAKRLDDPVSQIRAHTGLARVVERLGRYQEALEHSEHALDLYPEVGHQLGRARVLNNIGWFHALLGQLQEGLVCCRRALAWSREAGDPINEATTLDSVGYIHRHLGQHRQAIDHYEQAVDLMRSLGVRFKEAQYLTHLGDAHDAAGDHDAAGRAWRQALDIFDQLGHPGADRVRAELHGSISSGD